MEWVHGIFIQVSTHLINITYHHTHTSITMTVIMTCNTIIQTSHIHRVSKQVHNHALHYTWHMASMPWHSVTCSPPPENGVPPFPVPSRDTYTLQLYTQTKFHINTLSIQTFHLYYTQYHSYSGKINGLAMISWSMSHRLNTDCFDNT